MSMVADSLFFFTPSLSCSSDSIDSDSGDNSDRSDSFGISDNGDNSDNSDRSERSDRSDSRYSSKISNVTMLAAESLMISYQSSMIFYSKRNSVVKRTELLEEPSS